MSFEIVHKTEPEKVLYSAEKQTQVWQDFYEAENTFADSKAAFMQITRGKGYSCRKAK